MLNDTCPICLENISLEEEYICLPCQHLFHNNCYNEYIKNNYNGCCLCNSITHNNSSDTDNNPTYFIIINRPITTFTSKLCNTAICIIFLYYIIITIKNI